jgi:tetratricopeptide (TPR) repeat protein
LPNDLKTLIPTVEELRRLLHQREGNLSEVSFATLLLALAEGEKSVLLELRRNALAKQIIFEEGVPVDCRSNIATESLGRYLVSTGKLSENEYQASLYAAAARKAPLEEVLAEKGLIAPSEIFRLLQQNLGRKLLDAFTWRSGTWRISGDVPELETPLRVKVPQLILTGLVKLETPERVDEAVEQFRGKQLALAAKPILPLREFRFVGEQSAVISQLQKGSSLETLDPGGMPEEELHRFLYALARLGSLTVSDVPARRSTTLELELDEPEPAAVPLPPPPPVVAEKTMPAPFVAQADRPSVSSDDLLRAYLSFRRKDAFELLEIEEGSGVSVINASFVKFADRWLPTRFPEQEGLRDKAQEIFLAGARAFAELSDPDRRTSLVAKRTKVREEPVPEPEPAAAAPAPAVIDPEALHRQGRELADKGKYREALSYFDMAADCDAQNGNYAAELAWCRYQLMINSAQVTLKTLKNVMRIDPRAGAAFLHTGNIHAVLGNRLEAEGYLRKAQSMMPKDRRPGEALRALLAKAN